MTWIILLAAVYFLAALLIFFGMPSKEEIKRDSEKDKEQAEMESWWEDLRECRRHGIIPPLSPNAMKHRNVAGL